MLGNLAYYVSILVTFGVSLVVGLFVAHKKKISMVEALKGAEELKNFAKRLSPTLQTQANHI